MFMVWQEQCHPEQQGDSLMCFWTTMALSGTEEKRYVRLWMMLTAFKPMNK